MGEARTLKGRETRRRIVETAAHLMHVRGVDATSVDDVLEVARVGKGQFYHYFSGRGELEAAVLELHAGRQPEVIHPDWIPDGWAAVEAWFDSVYRLHEMHGFEGGCPLGSMASEVADRNDALRRRLAEAFRIKARHLARGLRELQRRGLLAAGADPDGLAEFAVAALQGGLLLARTQRSGAPLRNVIDRTLEHFRGLSQAADTP